VRQGSVSNSRIPEYSSSRREALESATVDPSAGMKNPKRGSENWEIRDRAGAISPPGTYSEIGRY
jgi:hypothetical protein